MRIGVVSDLADAVLPLIRTRRTDLYRWGASSDHGRQMHQAIDILEAAAEDPANAAEVYAVTHKAITSAITVIKRADDSSGIIGDACRRLLVLHPVAAARAKVPASRLVDWMIKFQFEGDVDYFELDPVAYAPALGEKGLAVYRARIAKISERIGPDPGRMDRIGTDHSHDWFTLEWNAQRLAVLDRDVEAIIATHYRDGKVAAWVQDTAEALEEIGEHDLAIEWAHRATQTPPHHQALTAAKYWCKLLAEHRPDELIAARADVFRRWPSADTAALLHRDAGDEWPTYRDEVAQALSGSPRDAVIFALSYLKDVQYAWDLAHELDLTDASTWHDLAEVYADIDPIATLPVHTSLVEGTLTKADAKAYRNAARRLQLMRRLAAHDPEAIAMVNKLVADLREEHRRRPRLQQEFDRVGLP